jgi:hypothetical protein
MKHGVNEDLTILGIFQKYQQNEELSKKDHEYGTALTTILPILFLYLNTVTVTAGTFEP